MSSSDWPVTVDPTYGCWLWQGHIDKREGYGLLWRGRAPIKAHIVVYTTEVGPIAEGLVLEHRCKVRRCCRPGHTKPMSQSENLLRRKWSTRLRRDLCDAKHDHVNAMVLSTGGVLCRLCDR